MQWRNLPNSHPLTNVVPFVQSGINQSAIPTLYHMASDPDFANTISTFAQQNAQWLRERPQVQTISAPSTWRFRRQLSATLQQPQQQSIHPDSQQPDLFRVITHPHPVPIGRGIDTNKIVPPNASILFRHMVPVHLYELQSLLDHFGLKSCALIHKALPQDFPPDQCHVCSSSAAAAGGGGGGGAHVAESEKNNIAHLLLAQQQARNLYGRATEPKQPETALHNIVAVTDQAGVGQFEAGKTVVMTAALALEKDVLFCQFNPPTLSLSFLHIPANAKGNRAVPQVSEVSLVGMGLYDAIKKHTTYVQRALQHLGHEDVVVVLDPMEAAPFGKGGETPVGVTRHNPLNYWNETYRALGAAHPRTMFFCTHSTPLMLGCIKQMITMPIAPHSLYPSYYITFLGLSPQHHTFQSMLTQLLHEHHPHPRPCRELVQDAD